MKFDHRIVRIVIWVFLIPIFQQEIFSQNLEFREEKDGILLLENNKPRYFYQTETKSLDGKYPRANYIHPLFGNDDEKITEDFPEDHLHQRGIFWTWHQLYAEGKRIGDPWLCEGVAWEIEDVQTEILDSKAVLSAEVLWMDSEENEAVIKEDLEITFKRFNEEVFALTFKIKLTALKEGIAIGGSEDEKGYGGFSARLKLPENVVFESENSFVKPQNLPIKAGPWITLKGDFEYTGTTTGITIMGEPEKLPHYQGWILRSENSMQNMAFPGAEPLPFRKGENLHFKNQILVHEKLSRKKITRYYKKFKNKNEK